MKCDKVMLIAGEASGDALASELVKELRSTISFSPVFFGAGGPKMSEAGVKISVDMMGHAVIGLGDVLRKYTEFRRIFNQLLKVAVEQQPDLIVLVDFSGFNRRFARAIRERAQQSKGPWQPKIAQFVSPQVWASRPSRADKMAKDIDLLLCLFPFEKEWYAKRVPTFKVEFVGHPIFDRYADFPPVKNTDATPNVLLLPGSRRGELARHTAVMTEAAKKIAALQKVRFTMVLPTDEMREYAASLFESSPNIELQTGNLANALARATVAIASTGTVLLECAYFGVPTVAMYRTSWSTYQIGKRIVQVKFLAMPNIMANEMIFPEFIQHDATPENISRAALLFLENPAQRNNVKQRLSEIIGTLGGAGASRRAAQAIKALLN